VRGVEHAQVKAQHRRAAVLLLHELRRLISGTVLLPRTQVNPPLGSDVYTFAFLLVQQQEGLGRENRRGLVFEQL
jgi:hypothetical protein